MRVTRITSRILVSHELTVYLSVSDLFLTQWIMIILSKGCKPDNFESHNSLKPSFWNIGGFHWNFVDWESFFEWNKLSWHFCSVWDKLGWLHWFWQFLCQGLSSLSNRFHISYAWSCILCEEGLAFTQDLSLENSADSYCMWNDLTQIVKFPT